MNQATLPTMQQPKTSSDDKFQLSDPDNLFRAIWTVLVRYQADGKEPGAEHWQADTRWKRPVLIADIREEWLTIMGSDELFPWHDDYVVYLWTASRKCPNPQKRTICDWLGLEVPRKWRSDEA